MSRTLVRRATKALTGSAPVPSDKSIGHRSFIFGAFARAQSRVKAFSYGEDNVATMRAFQAMGVGVEDDGQGTLVVHGQGLAALKAPPGPIDCGNSGTTMRLLAGVLAA